MRGTNPTPAQLVVEWPIVGQNCYSHKVRTYHKTVLLATPLDSVPKKYALELDRNVYLCDKVTFFPCKDLLLCLCLHDV